MSSGGKLKTTIEYGAARAALSGLSLLPRPAAVAAGRGFGRIAYALCGRLRRTGTRNLELAFPEMNERERQRILRGCFESLGRQLGEFSQLPKATPESLRGIVEYDAHDFQYLAAAKERGRGVIFVAMHLGAWELLVFAHSAFGNPMDFLMRPIDNPRIEEMIENIRTRFGNNPIDKKAALLAALRVLRTGGTIGILADLNTQPHEGVFVNFFGRLACTTAGVAALALRTDATIIPVCAPWDEKRQRYVFRGGPILDLVHTGDYKQDIALNTARFTAAIEGQIRRYPDQWLWIHKRWRTRPAGEPDLYSQPAPNPATTLPPPLSQSAQTSPEDASAI